ncbi:hypothetical protein M758_UG259300 [Ceratodon purpureus]|nr:hypothetical protein M758_UG259300 [Ceratodon purpureus]
MTKSPRHPCHCMPPQELPVSLILLLSLQKHVPPLGLMPQQVHSPAVPSVARQVGLRPILTLARRIAGVVSAKLITPATTVHTGAWTHRVAEEIFTPEGIVPLVRHPSQH